MPRRRRTSGDQGVKHTRMKQEHRISVALSYEIGDTAPIIVANGKDLIADRIVEIARENGIKLVQDEVLANVLSESEIGACIPEETYKAVAAIFAFLEKV